MRLLNSAIPVGREVRALLGANESPRGLESRAAVRSGASQPAGLPLLSMKD